MCVRVLNYVINFEAEGGERVSILAPKMHFNWKPEGGGAA